VGCAGHALVHGGRLGHHPLDGEALAHAGQTRLAHLAPERFLSQEPDDRPRHVVMIARRHQEPGPALVHDFRHATRPCGDDRLRAGHRVQERCAEPLGHRAHDEQIEALEATKDVSAEAGQQHVFFEVVLAHLPLELLAELAFTQDDEARVRHLPDDELRGLDQVTVPFVRHQRGDVADDRRAVGQPEGLVDVDGRGRQHMVDVNALVHRHRTVGWHAVADEHPPDGFRGGDEAVDLPVLPAENELLMS